MIEIRVWPLSQDDTAHAMELSMQSSTSRNQSQAGPRRRGRRGCDDETLDEAPQLLEDEPDNVEDANPVEENESENESIEKIEDAEESSSRLFDEGPPDHDEPHE